MTEPESKHAVEMDGRKARAERMKMSILRTTIAMVREGNLSPSAQQIADRSGVGIRSVFRHFDDMENLHSTFDQLLRDEHPERVEELDPSAPLTERIAHLIEHRIEIWELYSNIIQSTLIQLWRSKALSRNYARAQSELRKEMDEWLPELKKLDRTARESANATASFEMWNRLRSQQGLGIKQATRVVVSMLNSLFDK